MVVVVVRKGSIFRQRLSIERLFRKIFFPREKKKNIREWVMLHVMAINFALESESNWVRVVHTTIFLSLQIKLLVAHGLANKRADTQKYVLLFVFVAQQHTKLNSV
jgi:hypothetical protein